MAKNPIPKIGLALGSGGAKGLAHIGVLKTLEKHHIPIDYIAGTSIGAIFGGIYAAHKDVDKIENLVMNLNRKKGLELFDFTYKGGFMKGKKVENFLAETLEDATFETLKIPFAAVTTDVHTAESVIFTKGDMVKTIRASASIPAFYQPLLYKDRLLTDGGLSNPVPVDIIEAMGADVTIAVNLDTVYEDTTSKAMPALSRIPTHAINILRHNLAQQSIKTADVIIAPPDAQNIGIMGLNVFFNNTKAKEIIKIGENSAEKALPAILLAIKEYQYRQTARGKVLTFFKSLNTL